MSVQALLAQLDATEAELLGDLARLRAARRALTTDPTPVDRAFADLNAPHPAVADPTPEAWQDITAQVVSAVRKDADDEGATIEGRRWDALPADRILQCDSCEFEARNAKDMNRHPWMMSRGCW